MASISTLMLYTLPSLVTGTCLLLGDSQSFSYILANRATALLKESVQQRLDTLVMIMQSYLLQETSSFTIRTKSNV